MSGRDEVEDRQQRVVVGLVAGVAAMTILDLSKIGVALTSLDVALDAGPVGLQFIVAVYLLGYAVALVPGGILGDALGRRRVTVIGLSGALAASLVATVAADVVALVLARTLQGVAAGLLMPQLVGGLHGWLRPAALPRAFGVYGATVSTATALGPVVGGALLLLGPVEHSWRWLFAMNAPLAVLCVLLAVRLLPEDPPRRRIDIDWWALSVLSAALLAMLAPFVLSGDDGGTSWRWALLLVTPPAIALLVRRQRSRAAAGRRPLIDPVLPRIRSFLIGVGIGGCWFAANLGLTIVLPIHLQGSYGLSPLEAGAVTVPFALAAAVGSAAAGRMLARSGRRIVVAGLAAAVAGILGSVLAVLLLTDELRLVVLIAMQTITGLGAGFTVSPNQALTLADVPAGHSSAAGSLAQLSQRIGNAIGGAAAAAVVYRIVYADGDALTEATPAQFAHGAAGGLAVCGSFAAAALTVAIVDARYRRRQNSSQPSPARAQEGAR